MSAAGEERELVTDYAQLREGMLVVLSDCHLCSREHRAVLLKLINLPTGPIERLMGACATCWEIGPDPHAKPGEKFGLCACPVRKRRLYRVVDGLEDPAAYAAEIAHAEATARALRDALPPEWRKTPATSRVPFLPGRAR